MSAEWQEIAAQFQFIDDATDEDFITVHDALFEQPQINDEPLTPFVNVRPTSRPASNIK